MHDSIVFSMFVIFFGAAVLATLSLFVRQSLLVSYILLGVLSGPAVLGWVNDAGLLKELSHIGIVFLLFLLGLNLPLQKLFRMFGEATRVTVLSSTVFLFAGLITALATGLSIQEGMVVGLSLLFSSTIISLKLLPTTVLHHQRVGGSVISILLLQDIIAVIALIVLQGMGQSSSSFNDTAYNITLALAGLPLLVGIIYALNRWLLLPLMRRFDVIQEYVFLVAIGWCLGAAELASLIGLSHEMGAFVAGVVLASSPISLFVSEKLKPLRDFFLIIFFFSVGAGLNLQHLGQTWLLAVMLALAALLIKPLVLRWLMRRAGEEDDFASEVGIRLGQMSEFSLLIAVMAASSQVVSDQVAESIQLAALISFVVSSWWVVRTYPTPMGATKALFRD